MKTIYMVFVWAVLAICTFAKKGQANPELEEFVVNAMHNYTAWIASENLDPSIPNLEPITIHTSNTKLNITSMTCQFRNMVTSNFANVMFDDKTEMTDGDVFDRLFAMSYTVIGEKIEFSGNYTLVGATLNGTPITGKGRWTITIPAFNSGLFIHTMAFYGFSMTVDNRVDLSKAEYIHIITVLSDYGDNLLPDVGLEDLEANGYENVVKTLVYEEFRKHLQRKPLSYPMPRLLVEHFTEAFKTKQFNKSGENNPLENAVVANKSHWSMIVITLLFIRTS